MSLSVHFGFDSPNRFFAEMKKLADPVPEHRVFLRFRGFVDTFIVVAVSVGPGSRGEGAGTGGGVRWRVWVVTTRYVFFVFSNGIGEEAPKCSAFHSFRE